LQGKKGYNLFIVIHRFTLATIRISTASERIANFPLQTYDNGNAPLRTAKHTAIQTTKNALRTFLKALL
jgi:hypothetical protein